jgi:hypothetical protein
MNTKLTIYITILILFVSLLPTNVHSQSFSLFSIDTTNYPVLSAKFLKVTADGFLSPIPNSSLRLTENSVPRTILSVNCPPQTTPVTLSAVLTIDVSVSMGFGPLNATNMQFAKAASNAWINTLSVGNSECAITAFDQYNYLHQDFTKDKAKLKNALATLIPQGQTDFSNAFLAPPSGAISIAKNGKNKRIILFVTDGDAPDTDVATIVNEATNNGITVYCISIGRECPQSLKEISTNTGGLWFENVGSSLRAEQVFFEIFTKESTVAPCEITWESLNQCNAQTIIVSLENTDNQTIAELPYTIPQRKKGTIQSIPASVAFTDLPLFVPKDSIIFLRANGANTTISNIRSSNPKFTVTPTTGIIAENELFAVTIRYTPTDSSYQWTEFVVEHSYCNASFYASSRYSNAQVFPEVTLIKPNGGETFLTGTDTIIEWGGISPLDTVQLEYSNNNGNSWNLIESGVTGGSYKWTLPNVPGNEYLVKVSLAGKNDVLTDGWAKRSGSFFEDIGYSLCTTSDGSILSTGSFQGFANFGSTTIQLNSQGVEDVFILKIRPDGSPEWAKGIGGFGKDVGKKILSFPNNSFVVVGTFENSIVFEPGNQNEKTLVSNGSSDIFVAQYLADGTFVNAHSFGGIGNDVVNDACLTTMNEVLLTGSFSNTVSFGTFELFSNGLTDVFVSSITPIGVVQWATSFGGSNSDFGEGIGIATDGSVYVAATVKGSFTIGTFPVTSTGFDANAVVVKYLPTRTVEWIEQIGGIFDETATALKVDKNNDIIVAGTFVGTFSHQNKFFTSTGLDDIFLFKFDKDKNFLWSNTFGGTNFDKINSIFTDNSSSIYLAGFVQNLTSLGNSDLTIYGSKDVLIAKYSPNGINEWAITAGGNVTDEAFDVHVDNNGSVYSTGYFNSNATFGTFPLNTTSGFNEIFHWKIPTIRRKSFDISNTTFALIRVKPVANEIDFGNVLLQKTKDSIFIQSIRNTSQFVLTIDSVSISPNPDFRLFSNVPFTLNPNEDKDVEFAFAPKQLGLVESNLHYWVRSADTSNSVATTIKGVGIEPKLLLETPIIDFGEVEVTTDKDTLVPVVLRNIGSTQVTIQSATITGPNTIDFVKIAAFNPVTLQPNESISIELRFSPKVLGRTQSTIEFAHDSEGGIEKIFLLGTGIDYNQSIYSLGCTPINGTIGSNISIPLAITTVKAGNTFSNEIVKGFIRFNETVLAPILNTPLGVVIDGDRIIPFEFPLKNTNGNDNAYIFKIGLGNDSMTTISFENVIVENSTAEIEMNTCSVLVTDLCYDGGKRLLNPTGTSEIVNLSVNSQKTELDVSYTTIENGTTISVMTVLGSTLYQTTAPQSSTHLMIPIQEMVSGLYFIVMKSPTMTISKQLILTR